MAMPDSHRYPWYFYLINNMEDIFVTWHLKEFTYDNSNIFSCSRNALVALVEEPPLKLISFQTYIHLYILIHTWSDHTYIKGTIVKQALPSLHCGSFKITITIPLTLQLRACWGIDYSDKISTNLIPFKLFTLFNNMLSKHTPKNDKLKKVCIQR